MLTRQQCDNADIALIGNSNLLKFETAMILHDISDELF